MITCIKAASLYLLIVAPPDLNDTNHSQYETNNPQKAFETRRTSSLLEHPNLSIKIHEAGSLIAQIFLHVLGKKLYLGKKSRRKERFNNRETFI